jgi:hypothetical protein
MAATEATARDRFRQAHAAWRQVEAKMGKAVASCNAGTQALQDAQREVVGLEADAAAYAERCVAAGLQANGLDIEEHLKRQTRASFALHQARRRLAVLKAERDTVAAELARAQTVVVLALEAALADEAEAMAAEFQEIEQLGRQIRHSLSGLSRYWLSASERRAIRLGKTAMAVLSGAAARDVEPQYAGRAGGSFDPVALAQAHWQRVGQALMANPDIDIEGVA